jgi:hypothetical protein
MQLLSVSITLKMIYTSIHKFTFFNYFIILIYGLLSIKQIIKKIKNGIIAKLFIFMS